MAGESVDVSRAHLADAGVMELPDDWDVVTLGELLHEDRGIAVGVMYPGEHDPGGVPLIKAGDLNGSVINPNPDFRITPQKHYEYRRTALEGGELLMTLVGKVGQCAVVPPRMAGWNAARAVAVMRLAAPSDSHFVQQCLLSRPLQHLMDVWCNTTVQATLNLKEIRQLPLPWPPKQCRDAIAAFGRALDAKIECNRRMNATLESMARALFQSWFVDFDPVRAKLDGRAPTGIDPATAALFPDSFQDSALGPIPKGWRVGRLGDLCNLKRGHDLPSSKRITGSVPVISSSGISGTHSETTVRGPGVVTGRYGTIGKVFYVETDYWPLNTTLYVDDFRESPPRFIFHVLEEIDYLQYTDKAAVPGVNRNHLHEDPTVIPPMGVREMFARMISPLWSRHAANDKQSRTLAAIRDALLPKLLSGELRVAG